MRKRNFIGALGILTLFSTSAFASDLWLGQPAYGGSGCPQGTASAVLSPDGQSLSILFDQFQSQAGYPSGKRTDRKSCNIAVPVHVPQGYSISFYDIDYRGYNSLPSGASSRLNVEYFFAGARGPRFSRSFRGYLDRDFLFRNRLEAETVVWSPCGQDVNLRINASVTTTTNQSYQEAFTTVDSADVQAGLIYHIRWRRCN